MFTLRQRPRRVFIVNLDRVPGNQAAIGAIAAKVLGSQDRYAWYLLRYDIIVMAQAPPPGFLNYVASFGINVEIIVPSTINIAAIDMCDGFSDPRVREAVRHAEVDSYVPDERLARLVEAAGGLYVPCASDHTMLRVGDKHQLAGLSNRYPHAIPGQTRTGLATVAATVHRRLAQGRDTYVRISSRAGGGLGNFGFRAAQYRSANPQDIAAVLTTRSPTQWSHTTVALIEDYLSFTSTFGLAFSTNTNSGHSTYQISREGAFYGCWIPCPPTILPANIADTIVREHQHQLTTLGFHGNAQLDLGITADGTLRRIELNARLSGGIHIDLIRRLMRAEVAKALDVFYLRRSSTFAEAHSALQTHGLLARPGRPGAVISLPPNAGTQAMGIVAVGQSYEEVHGIYQQVAALLGNSARNTEDHPLFALS